MPECLVCDRSLEAPPKAGDYGGRKSIKCPRCGNFEIAGLPLLEVLIRQMQKKERMRLSAWIRTKRPSDFVITNENLEDTVQSFPNYRVLDQQLLLLRHLEDMTNHPGDRVQVDLEMTSPSFGRTIVTSCYSTYESSPGEGSSTLRYCREVRPTIRPCGLNR